MRVVLETPQVEGETWDGSRRIEIPDCTPPAVGGAVDLGSEHYHVRSVTLVVPDESDPRGAWWQVRLETVDQFVRRRDRDRAAAKR